MGRPVFASLVFLLFFSSKKEKQQLQFAESVCVQMLQRMIVYFAESLCGGVSGNVPNM